MPRLQMRYLIALSLAPLFWSTVVPIYSEKVGISYLRSKSSIPIINSSVFQSMVRPFNFLNFLLCIQLPTDNTISLLPAVAVSSKDGQQEPLLFVAHIALVLVGELPPGLYFEDLS